MVGGILSNGGVLAIDCHCCMMELNAEFDVLFFNVSILSLILGIYIDHSKIQNKIVKLQLIRALVTMSVVCYFIGL